jgi:hypothetical protein
MKKACAFSFASGLAAEGGVDPVFDRNPVIEKVRCQSG